MCLNVCLRPEAAVVGELSCLRMNGWYVDQVADKQYQICSPVFPHSTNKYKRLGFDRVKHVYQHTNADI